MAEKLRVAVIFGGQSGEHEVSVGSAQGIMKAMDKERDEIVPIGITKAGRWLTSGEPMKLLQSGGPGVSAQVAEAEPETRELVPRSRRALVPGTRETGVPQVDVIFPVLHGPYGEDGTVQGLLELADIPYVGAGVLGSALGMDKIAMKAVFRSHGLPVVEHVAFKRKDWEQDPEAVMELIEKELGYPCFVKPANLGSSVGISKVHQRGELAPALALAARYDRRMLAERAVNAREIEVSVLGNDEPIASLPGEIIPCREFYDYIAKYVDDRSELIIPADLPPELTRRIQELAVAAFLAVDCAGMARVDFFLDKDTGELYVGELNTIPGFTPISMYPKLWEASGISYSELIDRLIELALERHADNASSETSYSPEEFE
ncbi:MAG: D-alanine--D-alanine ligase [Anaerolineales bacterium]|nr:MAG: D-alanine--D-alanine ligase [Anaerolineales bacterium]